MAVAAMACAIRTSDPKVEAAAHQAGPAGAEPRQFRIDFGPDRIRDLHRRIDAMVWPQIAYDTGWTTGTNDRFLRDLAAYWRHRYDWEHVQRELNELPHFRVPIEGDQLHFVWYRGTGQRQPFPLLMVHGWPTSFLEFQQAAPVLMAGVNGKPGFDLVVPSVPGFVFSDEPRRTGVGHRQIGDRLHTLMQRLGYQRYGVQGYDWGTVIGGSIARQYPKNVVGLHLPGAPWVQSEARAVDEASKEFLARRGRFLDGEVAYGDIQRTKPQTLAYALQDSPVGWLAWMLEKYWAWSDHGGDLWSVFSRDHILTTAMLYWLPGRVLSAARIYHSAAQARGAADDRPIEVPTWFTWVPNDPFGGIPKSLWNSARVPNLVKVSELPRGGHFPAAELPKLWAEDVFRFFAALVR